MTAPNVDSLVPEGGSDAPTPQPSTEPTKPVAGDAAQLPGLVEAVRKVVAEELKPVKGEISGIYSRQDKDRNAFREFMDEYKKQKASGKSDADAEVAAQNALTERAEAVAEKQMLKDIHAKLFGSSPAGNGADEVAQIISQYHLDEKDPSVAKLYTLKGAELKAEAADMAFRRATKQPPSPEGAPVLGSPPASAESDVDLLGKLQEAQRRGDFNVLKALEAQARERGLYK